MIYLNLGCGRRYHPDFINIDIVALGPGVIEHDLRKGIPLPDDTCEVVYHSNVLEHFRRQDALRFMQECCRVLKPGGIVRAAVPDLERITRLYIQKLQAAQTSNAQAAAGYEWIMLELYDQTVREQSGGGILEYLSQDPIPNEEFVYERIGEEGRDIVARLRRSATRVPAESPTRGLRRLGRSFRRMAQAGLRRGLLLPMLMTPVERQALRIGEFRLQGEVHQWMYDRYSLALLMSQAGFVSPEAQTAATSQIPGWEAFHLDTLPGGAVVKPDALFVEARRPAQ